MGSSWMIKRAAQDKNSQQGNFGSLRTKTA
jgi:hypothetical protein